MGRHAMQEYLTPMSNSRARVPGSIVLIAVFFFLGVSVLLYPSAASWFSTLQQSRDVNSYGNSVEILGPVGRSEALASAHDYNSTLTGGALLDPFSHAAADAPIEAEQLYQKQLALNPDGVMARLRVPSINVDLPVLHGTSDEVLKRGVGHLFGTALPVGGQGTHTVLTGHAGIPEATLFTHLEDVVLGDSVDVEVYGEVLTYQVNNIEVILPTETESLRPVPGQDLISLITCTPTGINTHRLVVTAVRVPTPEQAVADGGHAVEIAFPWWAVGLGLAAAGSTTILLLSAKRGRQREES